MKLSVFFWALTAFLACSGGIPDARALGTVEGAVAMEAMKPATGPGYRVQTRNPVETPDPAFAVVYLETEDGKYPKSRVDQVVHIGQRGYQFRPAVLAVQTGTRITFPNEDDEFHNVFSYSPAKPFDLGRFRKDEKSPLLTFEKPGLVKIYCEIHKHMRNLLLVLDTPWFATTDDKGRYSLHGIPAGTYTLKAFLPSEKTLQARVTVIDGKTSIVDLAR